MNKIVSEYEEEINKIAHDENITREKLVRRILSGYVVIPFNRIHSPKPIGIGEGLRVKINTNIGTSTDYADINDEIKKVKCAIEYGTDTLMDLSIGGNLSEIRKKILKTANIPVGTVPIYESAITKAKKGYAVVDMTEDDIFNAIENQAKEGVDFMTVHCGVTKESVKRLVKQKRILGVVSRGGAILTAWILHNNKENPLYKNFDYLLEIAQKYHITLSLGDGLRPGCIADASDKPQFQELIILGELVKHARKKSVQVMVEGPGHIPINEIEANVRIEKSVCDGAPFYVLGPLVTDIAPGYDHITAAIGGAFAAYFGADFLCYVTPTEHLGLPTIEDVKEGVIASKIAAHAADIAKGRDRHIDKEISYARRMLDWDKQINLAIDRKKASEIRKKRKSEDIETCSMCGELCAIKFVRKFLFEGK